jgi:hypothetical protein
MTSVPIAGRDHHTEPVVEAGVEAVCTPGGMGATGNSTAEQLGAIGD